MRPLLLLIFVSGSAGLIYQITWTRQLHLLMGGSVHAVTTVLAAFMGGLALGSAAGARWAPRLQRPVLTYAVLEAAIAVIGWLSPLVLGALPPVLVAVLPVPTDGGGAGLPLLAVRFAVASGLLLLPTSLMGATLPFVARAYVSGGERMGRSLGRLYGASSAGAVTGALAAGFILLPALGLSGGCRFAALLNAAAALGAVLIARLGEPGPEPAFTHSAGGTGDPGGRTAGRGWVRGGGASGSAIPLMAAAALAGAATMALEVSWSRTFSLLFGSSIYAYAIVLGAFIGGIALGSAAPSRLFDRWGEGTLPAAVALSAASICSIVVLHVGPRLPLTTLRLFWRFGSEPGAVFSAQLVLAWAVLLPATFFTGAAFPLLVRSLSVRRGESPSRALGRIYAVNTAAAVAGSVIAGFVLLPAVGAERTALAGALVLAAAGGVLAATGTQGTVSLSGLARALPPLLLAAAVGLPLVLRPWDAGLITCGPFIYAGQYKEIVELGQRWDPDRHRNAAGRVGNAGGTDPAPLQMSGPPPRLSVADLRKLVRSRGEMVFFKEGAGATVSVRRSADGILSLQINGKTDASTGGDMKLQVLTAHLPLLLHRNPGRVFVLGLASGVTLGQSLRHPEVTRVVCAEISGEVVEASRLFDGVTGAPLEDPRVTLHVEDGRTVMASCPPRSFDVIISQPSNPWLGGMTDLFSAEFFHLVHSRLADGGIFCQWVQSYALTSSDLRSVTATFLSAFPAATLWAERAAGGDYLLIGIRDGDPAAVTDPATLAGRMHRERIREALAGIDVTGPSRLLAHFVCGADGLARFSEDSPLVTDDNIRLEFTAPLALHRKTLAENLSALLPYRSAPDALPAWLPLGGAEERKATERALASQMELERSCLAALRDDLTGAVLHLESALALDSENPEAGQFLTDVAPAFCDRLVAEGNPAGCLLLCRLCAALPGGLDAGLLRREGQALLALGLTDRAAVSFGLARQLSPGDAGTANLLGMALYRSGNLAGAQRAFEDAVRLDAGVADAWANLGSLAFEKGRLEEAERHFREALRLEPANAVALNNLAVIMRRTGRVEEAVMLYRQAIEAAPDRAEFRQNLQLLLEEEGESNGDRLE